MRPRPTALILILFTLLAIALFCLGYPIYVIRPFRHQGIRELALALQVMRFRGLIAILCALSALVALASYWRLQPRLAPKIFAIAAAALICLSAALSRLNVYELMFHPIDEPGFVSARTAKLDGAESVLAIRVGSAARAYPIRSISYHHVVNDSPGGIPIVATY